jgi:hypothetical protein
MLTCARKLRRAIVEWVGGQEPDRWRDEAIKGLPHFIVGEIFNGTPLYRHKEPDSCSLTIDTQMSPSKLLLCRSTAAPFITPSPAPSYAAPASHTRTWTLRSILAVADSAAASHAINSSGSAGVPPPPPSPLLPFGVRKVEDDLQILAWFNGCRFYWAKFTEN